MNYVAYHDSDSPASPAFNENQLYPCGICEEENYPYHQLEGMNNVCPDCIELEREEKKEEIVFMFRRPKKVYYRRFDQRYRWIAKRDSKRALNDFWKTLGDIFGC